jgi:ADP-ribose pyrophosphatase
MPELWDVFDQHRKPTGRTVERGKPMPPEDFHLVALSWIVGTDNRILLMKRSPEKEHGGNMWSLPSGSAVAGETSLDAAIREAHEESGVTLSAESGKLVHQYTQSRSGGGYSTHYDHWLFRRDVKPEEITFQPGETCGYRFATFDELFNLIEQNRCFGFTQSEVEIIQNQTQ